jgi:hypothetical protein
MKSAHSCSMLFFRSFARRASRDAYRMPGLPPLRRGCFRPSPPHEHPVGSCRFIRGDPPPTFDSIPPVQQVPRGRAGRPHAQREAGRLWVVVLPRLRTSMATRCALNRRGRVMRASRFRGPEPGWATGDSRWRLLTGVTPRHAVRLWGMANEGPFQEIARTHEIAHMSLVFKHFRRNRDSL